jgi:hypothetical protein
MCGWTLASIATSSERAAAPLVAGPVNEDRRTVQACPWTLSESGADGFSGAAAARALGPGNEDRLKTSSTALQSSYVAHHELGPPTSLQLDQVHEQTGAVP